MNIFSTLKNAGVAAELIAAVAVAIEAARAEGVEVGKEQYKIKNAERQKRFREKGRSVTSNVTNNVTNNATSNATEDNPRARVLCCEDSIIITPVIANAITAPKGAVAKSSRVRGSRISEEWTPRDETVTAIASEVGWSELEVRSKIVEFIDFWISMPGAKATKTDWDRTFKNRIRQIADGRKKFAQPNGSLVSAPRSIALVGKVFVEKDSNAWRAWCEHKGVTSMPTLEQKTAKGVRQGWYMETEWPPASDSVRAM